MPFGRAWFGWGRGWSRGFGRGRGRCWFGWGGGWAGALAGVGLGMACLTEDTDLATPAMVMVQHRPMATTPGKGV